MSNNDNEKFGLDYVLGKPVTIDELKTCLMI